MDDIKAAISAVEMDAELTAEEAAAAAAAGVAQSSRSRTQQRLAPGQIGEGKHTPLSKAQRKKAL